MPFDAVNLISQLGRFAILLVAVCLAVIVLFSVVDRHPRDPDSPDEEK